MQGSSVVGSRMMQSKVNNVKSPIGHVHQQHRAISRRSWPFAPAHRHLQRCRVRDSSNGTGQPSTRTADSSGSNGSLPGSSPLDMQQQQRQSLGGEEMECVATGMDVSCRIPDDGDSTYSSSIRSSSTGSSSSSSSSSSGAVTSTSTDEGSSHGLLQRALATALLVSPFFFWGTSMVAMKGVTEHTTPLFLGSLRLLPAGLVLVAWAAAQGRPQPNTAIAWAWVTAFALVDGAAFQGFLAEGLNRTSAGLGSVIIDSQPLTVAVLAALLFGERLSGAGIAGLFIGVAGLLLLEVPEPVLQQGPAGLVALLSGGGELAPGPLLDNGEFWMLLAAQSMAVGTVMVRYVTKHCDPVMATGWHMVLGGALLAAAAVSGDGAATLAERLPLFTGADAASMLYVSMLGGAASYGIFFYEASKGNLTALSSLTFLTPMFAAGGGYLVLGESLTPLQLLGACVTLAAVFLINTQPSAAPDAKQ